MERAHHCGALTSASLMVAAPATADAVRRAKTMPGLAVGLHVVTIEGPAVLPASAIPDLVDAQGQFPSAQFRLGMAYGFRSRVRCELAAEIRAQFVAFAKTGLALDHANAHKHMHLHPVVGRLLIGIGHEFGLRALRVPAEPPAVLAASGAPPSPSGRMLFHWTRLLRWQARRAGLLTNDHCFGTAWSGAMTTERVLQLIPNLPDGISEIYFHPASYPHPDLHVLMPNYQQEAELAALLDPGVRRYLAEAGQTTSYGEIVRGTLDGAAR